MLNHADFILGPHLIITVLLLNCRYYPLVAQYESVILSCKLYLHSQYCQNLVCALPNFNCVERWGQSCFWFSCAINLQSGLGSLGQINVPLSFLHYRITLICKEIKHFSFLLLLAFVVFHFFSLWKVSFFFLHSFMKYSFYRFEVFNRSENLSSLISQRQSIWLVLTVALLL